MKAPLPPDESQRLESLRRYAILDTPPEAPFEDLTLLAAQTCQTPIALVSLVDETRQWFKSRVGLDATETSRDLAFCAHAILNRDDVLEVRDARLDPRFADNPLVTADPNIRFYAGAPLVARDGHVLGTLCVIDRAPRMLSQTQKQALQALSRHVVTLLELRRTIAERERLEERLRLVVESSPNALVTVDREGRITLINAPAEHLFGFSREELVGQPVERLVPERFRAAHPQHRAGFVADPRARAMGAGRDLFGVRKDGREVPIEIGLNPIATSEGPFVLASIIDITERKQLETELRERVQLAQFQVAVGATLTGPAEVPALLQRCAQLLVDTFGAAFARIWTLNDTEPVLELQASAGLYTHLDGPHGRVPVGRFKIGLIAQERQPHVTNQVIGDPRVSDQDWARREGMVAFAGYPLLVEDKVVGVMAMFARHPLAERHLEAMGTVASNVALAVERKRAEARLRALNASLLRQASDLAEARDRAEASDRLKAAILVNAAHAIISTTPDGVITTFNPAAERLLGYAAAEVVGRQTPAIIHDPAEVAARAQQFSAELGEPIAPGFEVFVARARRNLPNEYEWTYVRKDGSRFPVLLSVTALRDAAGQITGFLGLAVDITARRRAEELLRAKNDELKGFAYTVSHDLKAPLRGISGYAQELERRHKAGLAERAQFCITQIITAAKNLDDLIEDLLEYSRLEAETPAVTEVMLPALVHSILRDRGHTLDQLGVVVTVNVPPIRLRTWERGLHQALTNLIDNAVKYSRHARPPRLTLTADARPGAWRVTVADNGIGFDMKYHDRIFGLFNRLVHASEFEGTGAGLAIVKRLMDKLGGTIRAESTPGQGATFVIELPTAAPAEPTP
jgi:PAS domain S-box-containing protein